MLKRRHEQSNEAAEKESTQPETSPLEGRLEPLRTDAVVMSIKDLMGYGQA